jgi:hypothetical protein
MASSMTQQIFQRRLLDLLRSLPAQTFENEIDFARLVIPSLSEVLGYTASQTFYERGSGRFRADVVFSNSVTARPWVVIELKTHRLRNIGDAVYQLRRYLDVFGSDRGIVLSPQVIVPVVGAGAAEPFELASISLEQVEKVFRLFERAAQAAAVEPQTGSNRLVELVELAERASSNEEKGKTLESVAQCILESVPALHCKYTNLRTRSSEIDIVVEYEPSRGRLPLFDELGRYTLVECKNWSKAVGVSAVRDFMGKLDKCQSRLGIIFSRHGVTGVDSGADALREIQSRFDRDGTFLVVFSLEELRKIACGRDFVAALDRKVDALLFDAEMC